MSPTFLSTKAYSLSTVSKNNDRYKNINFNQNRKCCDPLLVLSSKSVPFAGHKKFGYGKPTFLLYIYFKIFDALSNNILL
jgi:hypothetical protein